MVLVLIFPFSLIIVNIIGYGCKFVIFISNVVHMIVKCFEHTIRFKHYRNKVIVLLLLVLLLALISFQLHFS